MPFSLIPDQLGRDPRWGAMADGRRALRDGLGWSYVRMMCESASHTDDGYLTREQALACCDGRAQVLELLATPMLGRPPLLHQPDQKCAERNCIDASPPWVDGFAFRICGYLKRNPSKAEKARNDAQKRDLNDPTLRTYVYERDGGCCRYCRSGPLKRQGMGRAKDHRRVPHLEHWDPDRDAGPDREGVVQACKGCNEFKGRRTPDEAGIVLLPVPTPEQVAYWRERGEQQFDRPEPGQEHPADMVPDNPPDNVIDNAETTSRTTRSGVVDQLVPSVVQHALDTPAGDHVSAGGAQDNPVDNGREGSGSGRVGQPLAVPVLGALGQPLRDSSAPDIYTGRSRAPASHSPPGGDPRSGGGSRAP